MVIVRVCEICDFSYDQDYAFSRSIASFFKIRILTIVIGGSFINQDQISPRALFSFSPALIFILETPLLFQQVSLPDKDHTFSPTHSHFLIKTNLSTPL